VDDNQANRVLEAVKWRGFELPEPAETMLSTYASLIKKANPNLNLLSEGDVKRLWQRHLLDSLTPLLLGIIEPKGTLLDIGSGAGLPGIPLAIAAPKLFVTMLESSGKKARFIERCIAELGLSNANVLNIRADDFSKNAAFDYCTTRAVSLTAKLLRLMASQLKAGGKVILFTGPKTQSEIRSVQKMSSKYGFLKPEIVIIPPELSERRFSLVVLRKV